MAPPDFITLLGQFEQQDMQKEQLLMQRQEQSARNIAQAVTTLVQIAPEARAGYLQTLQNELGLDTRFLQALSQSAPTPTQIMLTRGLESAIAQGDVTPQTIAANAMGMKPIEFQIQSQMSEYARTGKLPKFIAGIKDPAQRDAALQNFLAQSAGNASIGALEEQADPSLTRNERKQGARIGAGLAVDKKTQYQEGAQTGRVGMQIGQALREMQQQDNQFYSAQRQQREIVGVNNTSAETQTWMQVMGRAQAGAAGKAGNMYVNPLFADMDQNQLTAALNTANSTNMTAQSTRTPWRAGDLTANRKATEYTQEALLQEFKDRAMLAAQQRNQVAQQQAGQILQQGSQGGSGLNYNTGINAPFTNVPFSQMFAPR